MKEVHSSSDEKLVRDSRGNLSSPDNTDDGRPLRGPVPCEPSEDQRLSTEREEPDRKQRNIQEELEQYRDKLADASYCLEHARQGNASLASAIRNLSDERTELQRALQSASELRQQLEKKNYVLQESLQQVTARYEVATAELHNIKTSMGWHAIERYRRWRLRHIANRPRLITRYEEFASWLCRKIGISQLQVAEDSYFSIPTAEDLIPTQTAKFALIISGCPGDALRYRSEHQAEELRLLGLTVDTSLFDSLNYDQALSQYDVFILHRVPHTPGVEIFIRQARNLGKPVVFDTDDLVFNESLVSHIKALRYFSKEEYNLYVSGVRRYHQTLSLCTSAIVTTEHLSDSIKELFPNMPVYINRNAVSDRMVQQSEHILQYVPKPDDGYIRVAYFSGTRTHQDDFAVCVPALERLLRMHPAVRLMAVGHLDIPEELKEFIDRIEITPLVPWQELPALMRRVDINLAPLELNNRFTAAKSELKYFETGLLGVPTVASDTPSYRHAITPGENGLLCTTSEDWFQALEKLVLDAGLRERMGAKAREDVLQRYTTRSRAPQLASVARKILQQHGLDKTAGISIAIVMRAPIAQTGGGYKTIFSLAHHLARRGHDLHLYVEPVAHLTGKSEAEIISFCQQYFGKSSARIHVGHHAILPCDIAVATNWPTAYTVAQLPNAKCKAYLVQDFEPEFYHDNDPSRAEAERTYDLPLKKIVIGKYLATLFSQRDRMPTAHFPFFLDRALYCNNHVRPKGPARILFFARPGLKRRAYPVGVEALRRVARACPEVQIAFYGMAQPQNLGFRYQNLGELSRQEVARQMNLSHIHLSFSLTNISWVPFEAMACGCAVVEAKVPSVELWMGDNNQNCLLVDPEPRALAEALITLAKDPVQRARIASNGEQYVSTVSASWEQTCARFEEILLESVLKHRKATAVTTQA